MRKNYILAIIIVLAGCAGTQYQGVSGNAFPRHELNYLFSESFSLDYTDLKASEWQKLAQVTDGAYAVTEVIPKSETSDHWQKKYTIIYYPNITVKQVSNLSQSVLYLKNQLQESHSRIGGQWTVIENSDDYYIAEANNALYRLFQTDAGLNVLIYSQQDDLSDEQKKMVLSVLKQAQVIGYTPKSLINHRIKN